MSTSEPRLLVRGPLRRLLALFLLPFGLICIAFPAAQLVLKDEAGLIDDTRAWFGAGTAEGVPKVTQVSCLEQRHGSPSQRGVGLSDWRCVLDLAAATRPAEDDPFAGRSYDEGMKEYNRRLSVQLQGLLTGASLPSRLERVLPSDRTGDLPLLRRLSGRNEPPRFGVVWGGAEIVRRWLSWLVMSALFLAFGAACLYAAWKANRG
jgi:hypothetical protein